jgi:hypothetical protein
VNRYRLPIVPFEVPSRYAHVLVHGPGPEWRLVNAQGTGIADRVLQQGQAW